jgi:hypothetical protein
MAGGTMTADLVLKNGAVYTMDKGNELPRLSQSKTALSSLWEATLK